MLIYIVLNGQSLAGYMAGRRHAACSFAEVAGTGFTAIPAAWTSTAI
ncbi:hypothetical protein [Crossiella sp. NPDC003009]